MQCDELIIILSVALSGLLKLESRKVCRKKGPHTDIHNRWKLNQGKRKEKTKSIMRVYMNGCLSLQNFFSGFLAP